MGMTMMVLFGLLAPVTVPWPGLAPNGTVLVLVVPVKPALCGIVTLMTRPTATPLDGNTAGNVAVGTVEALDTSFRSANMDEGLKQSSSSSFT